MGDKGLEMSHKNYQSNQRKKNAKSIDQSLQGKETGVYKQLTDSEIERSREWNTVFRKNPQYFAEFILGIKLYEYQRFWLYMMQHSTRFLALASRGTAKSFMVAVFACIRAILYPETIILLASRTKKQSGLIVTEKVQWLNNTYPALKREIKKIKKNENDYSVEFKNGSKIISVVSNPNSRGYRAHMLIIDESRQVTTEILDTILKPVLMVRRPPFALGNKEYDDYVEQPIYIQITSVGYKGEEWDIRAKQMLKQVIDGSETTRVLFWDYLLTLKHHIRSREQIIEDKIDMDSVFFQMELGNRPYGGSRKSYYQYSMFKRALKRPWLPIRFDMSNPKQKNKYDIPRATGEKRLISVDCASAPGDSNDLTSISCFRLIPIKKGYKSSLVYIETFSGRNVELQALRIKEIYSEFTTFTDGDILVLDILNVGRSIYDLLTSVTSHSERDIDYPPMKVMVHPTIPDTRYKDFNDRAISRDAYECIYPIAGSSVVNSEIASSFRSRLKSGRLLFLVETNEQEEIYIKKKNLDMTQHEDQTLKPYVLSPNVNTGIMINESISLEKSLVDGDKIKLKERPGQRKDRYSSVSYGNYVIGILENEFLKEDDDATDLETLLGAFGVV